MKFVKALGRVLAAILLILAAALGGCAKAPPPTVLTKTVYVPVSPPDNLMVCPQIKASEWPHPEIATNQEISNFIAKLYRYNKTCGLNMAAIKGYVKAAEKRLS
jgi:hypothetical protein